MISKKLGILSRGGIKITFEIRSKLSYDYLGY